MTLDRGPTWVTIFLILALTFPPSPAWPEPFPLESAARRLPEKPIEVPLEESSLDKLEMSEKLARFRDSFVEIFKELTRQAGALLFPQGQTLTTLGTVPAFSVIASPEGAKQSLSPLYSHSGGGRFQPLEPASFDPVLLASLIERPLLTDYLLNQTRGTVPAFSGTVPLVSLAGQTPVSIGEALFTSLTSSLNLASLQKPIPYQGIKTSDRFAQDPVPQNPLPFLVNPETTGTAPLLSQEVSSLRPRPYGPKGPEGGNLPNDAEAIPQPPPSSIPQSQIPASPAGDNNPQFIYTPLIWDALASSRRREEEYGQRKIVFQENQGRKVSIKPIQREVARTSSTSPMFLLSPQAILGGVLAKDIFEAYEVELWPYLHSNEKGKYSLSYRRG